MKILLLVIASVLLLASNCKQPENHPDTLIDSEKKMESMLFDFYSQYFKLWENPSLPHEAIHKKLDSLMLKYCTAKLITEANEASHNSGVDILTNNLVSVDLNEDLKVEKSRGLESSYFVSFLATYKDVPGGPIKKPVTLSVKVVKVGTEYKIESVE